MQDALQSYVGLSFSLPFMLDQRAYYIPTGTKFCPPFPRWAMCLAVAKDCRQQEHKHQDGVTTQNPPEHNSFETLYEQWCILTSFLTFCFLKTLSVCFGHNLIVILHFKVMGNFNKHICTWWFEFFWTFTFKCQNKASMVFFWRIFTFFRLEYMILTHAQDFCEENLPYSTKFWK